MEHIISEKIYKKYAKRSKAYIRFKIGEKLAVNNFSNKELIYILELIDKISENKINLTIK